MSDLLAKCDWNGDELRVELPQWPEVVNVWVDGKAMPFVPVTDPDALGAIKCLQGLADATSVENEKLREERDHWHVEQVHAYGNWEDAHRRATELEVENKKLRELAKLAVHSACFGCPHNDKNAWRSCGGCNLYEMATELGIEVDG